MRIINARNIINTYETLRAVMYGGKGRITMISPSGTSHEYLFSKPRNATEFPDDVVFVYAVHENKQFYIGMIEQDRFRLTRNSRYTPDTEIVKGAEYFMKLKSTNRIAKSPMTLVHGDRCAKCGRKIDSKFGNMYGCGKSCYNKLVAAGVIHVECR